MRLINEYHYKLGAFKTIMSDTVIVSVFNLKGKVLLAFLNRSRPWALLMSLGTGKDLFQELQCSTRQWLDVQLWFCITQKALASLLSPHCSDHSEKWEKRSGPLYTDPHCSSRNPLFFHHNTWYSQGQCIWNQEISFAGSRHAKFPLHKERWSFTCVLCVYLCFSKYVYLRDA